LADAPPDTRNTVVRTAKAAELNLTRLLLKFFTIPSRKLSLTLDNGLSGPLFHSITEIVE
jgi:hypothetical protein